MAEKKQRINSRSKGNKAERDLAKQLKGWANKDFARCPSSGGLQWGAAFAKGDIICTTEGHYFPFCIEVKFHKEIDTNNMLVGKKDSKILSFWDQCCRDAKEAKKIPLLLMRYNNLPRGEWLVGMAISDYNKLFNDLDEELGSVAVFTTHRLVLMNSAILFGSKYKSLRSTVKTYLKKRWPKLRK